MNALEALHQCKRAWERTQPQLFWTDDHLWGGLDERDAGAVLLVEPESRLDTGLSEGIIAPNAAATVLLSVGSQAPQSCVDGGLDLQAFDGDGANPSQVARRPQKGV